MNILDLGILAVIATSVIFGLYRGFIASVANTGGALLSFIASFWLRRPFANLLGNVFGVRQLLVTYTDSMVRTGYAGTVVSEISSQEMPGVAQQVISGLNLPTPFADLVKNNLTGGLLGAGKTVQAYVSESLVNACVNILSFVLCFILLYVLFSVGTFALRVIFKLPVLKQTDTLAGGIFGFLRALVFLFVVFTLMPVAQSLVPGDTVQNLMNGSLLAGIFNSGALISSIIRGSLF